jgi:V-type H+-transporting ATPase subunit a
MAFAGRYVILIMSVFAIYMGFVYNECFSMPLSLFGKTQWECDFDSCADQLNFKYGEATNGTWATTPDRVQEMWVEHGKCACPLAVDRSTPYVFGVDPAWHGTKTELTFVNSVKMKMSIILGVTQMTLGIVCSLYKFLKKPVAPDRYEVDRLSIFCEFVPQILFLMAMFGYLSLLIIIKWISGSVADLFFIMVNLFLAPGTNSCGDGCPETDPLYGLGPLNGFIVFVCMVCVPWMLIPKPVILKKRHEARGGASSANRYDALDDDLDSSSNTLVAQAADHEGKEDFDFQEVFVLQMIHTIEFVLGAMSNTASYLRLWALSLAHSQLSDVFYKLVLMSAVQMKNTTAIFVGVFVWAMATFVVLMIMETLSAFLHALRLHWVEYMNKFYNGDGKLFTPFSFAALAAEADEPSAK